MDVEDRYIQYNWILLDAVGISYDETSNSDAGAGFSFMTVACVLVGLLVLFAAGLVIYNILKISITKRIKEYGTLRGNRRRAWTNLSSCFLAAPDPLAESVFRLGWYLAH